MYSIGGLIQTLPICLSPASGFLSQSPAAQSRQSVVVEVPWDAFQKAIFYSRSAWTMLVPAPPDAKCFFHPEQGPQPWLYRIQNRSGHCHLLCATCFNTDRSIPNPVYQEDGETFEAYLTRLDQVRVKIDLAHYEPEIAAFLEKSIDRVCLETLVTLRRY